MSSPFRLALVLFVACIAQSAYAQNHPTCGSPPAVTGLPKAQEEKLKGQLEGRAKILSKLVADGSLGGEIESSKKTLYQDYPNLDQAVAFGYFQYVTCVAITNDTSSTLEQKLKALELLKPPTRDRRSSGPIVDRFEGDVGFTEYGNAEFVKFLEANVGRIVHIKTNLFANDVGDETRKVIKVCGVNLKRLFDGRLNGMTLPISISEDNLCDPTVEFSNMQGEVPLSYGGTGTWFIPMDEFFQVSRRYGGGGRMDFFLRRSDVSVEVRNR